MDTEHVIFDTERVMGHSRKKMKKLQAQEETVLEEELEEETPLMKQRNKRTLAAYDRKSPR
jgi:hypothetical protein